MIGLLTTFSCCSSSPASALAFTSATKIVLLAFSSHFFFGRLATLKYLITLHSTVMTESQRQKTRPTCKVARWVHSGCTVGHALCTLDVQCVYRGKLSLILIPTQISFFKLQIEIEFSKHLQCSSSFSLSLPLTLPLSSSASSSPSLTPLSTLRGKRGRGGSGWGLVYRFGNFILISLASTGDSIDVPPPSAHLECPETSASVCDQANQSILQHMCPTIADILPYIVYYI